MSVAVRLATEADLPAILACLRVLRPVAEPSPITFRAISTYPGVAVLVAEADGAVVGTASLYKVRHLYGASAQVEDVAVLPEWQGKGVGRLLLTEAVTQARRWGCYKVTLHCSEGVAGFYERCWPFMTRQVAFRLGLLEG